MERGETEKHNVSNFRDSDITKKKKRGNVRWAETGEEEKGFVAHNALDYKYVRQKTKEKLLKRTIWAFETLKNSLFWTKAHCCPFPFFPPPPFSLNLYCRSTYTVPTVAVSICCTRALTG